MADIKLFAPAGERAILFNVAEGVSNETALEFASAFLASVVELGIEGAGKQDGERWAIVYLCEAAKALIDTARPAENFQAVKEGAPQ